MKGSGCRADPGESAVTSQPPPRPAAKSYDGEGIVVGFDSHRCLHAAECVRGLPTVFDVDRRPWIQPDNAPARRGRRGHPPLPERRPPVPPHRRHARRGPRRPHPCVAPPRRRAAPARGPRSRHPVRPPPRDPGDALRLRRHRQHAVLRPQRALRRTWL
ncbi:LOW QUALITY PROTEIN: conserved hypothetical protein, partial [Streptomyces filamentosus NRRL 15998]